MNPIIIINNLSKKYGDKIAVDHLTLKINKGEVFGLLGPNGAGKSTTILMLLGLSEPAGGTVKVCGHDSTKEPIEVKKKVGYLPDQVGFYGNRTGLENLILTATLNGMSRTEGEEKARQLLDQVGLTHASDQKAGTYSRGMKQRLGLADVLIKNPGVIILDEPTLGIDPKGVQELLQLIRSLSKEHGITVLLSSHHLHQVQQICDRVGLFVNGKLLAHGDIDSLARQLFGELGRQIKINAAPITEDLMRGLRGLNGVEKVQFQKEVLTIWCNEHLTIEKIIQLLLQENCQLESLSQEKIGLDEIYQRYFEGGDQHEITREHQSINE